MTFERSTIRVAIAGLMLFITGCAEDGDDAADTLASNSGGPGTTEAPPPDGSTSDVAPGEDDSDHDEDADTMCDPACGPEQMCVGGLCFDRESESGTSGGAADPPPSDDSTGEPPSEEGSTDGSPAECGLSDHASFPSPECEQCLTSSCCEQLQGCYGDGTSMMPTECAQLNQCIRAECAGLTNPMELNQCASMNCADFTGASGMLIPVRLCTNMNCQAQCT